MVWILSFHDAVSKAGQTAAGGPLHRFCASLHAHGGASYAVTHSRRKYRPHIRVLARSFALAALRRWWYSLARKGVMAHPPRGSADMERIWLPCSVVPFYSLTSPKKEYCKLFVKSFQNFLKRNILLQKDPAQFQPGQGLFTTKNCQVGF